MPLENDFDTLNSDDLLESSLLGSNAFSVSIDPNLPENSSTHPSELGSLGTSNDIRSGGSTQSLISNRGAIQAHDRLASGHPQNTLPSSTLSSFSLSSDAELLHQQKFNDAKIRELQNQLNTVKNLNYSSNQQFHNNKNLHYVNSQNNPDYNNNINYDNYTISSSKHQRYRPPPLPPFDLHNSNNPLHQHDHNHHQALPQQPHDDADADADAVNSPRSKKQRTSASDKPKLTDIERKQIHRDKNRASAKKNREAKKKKTNDSLAMIGKMNQQYIDLQLKHNADISRRLAFKERVSNTLYRFLYMRSRNEKDHRNWLTVLDENVVMTLPQTMFRSTRHHETTGGLDSRRRVVGIDSVMADTQSLHLMLNLITNRIRLSTGRVIAYFAVDPREVNVSKQKIVSGTFVDVDGQQQNAPPQPTPSDDDDDDLASCMSSWKLYTKNAVELGARQEFCCCGMIRVDLSKKNNKIKFIEWSFDSSSVQEALRASYANPSFGFPSMVPNTVEQAIEIFDKAFTIVEAHTPNSIIYVSDMWLQMTGFTRNDIKLGRGSQIGCLNCLNCPSTNMEHFGFFHQQIEKGLACSTVIWNAKKNGSEFFNFIQAYPLIQADTSRPKIISHFLVVSRNLGGRT